MTILQNLSSKKFRYILYSLGVVLLLFWVETSIGYRQVAMQPFLFLTGFTVVGAIVTQYTSITDYRGFLVVLLPVLLVLGAFFTLFHFPNFSLAFKLSGLGVVGVLLYLVNLVNNIFLVVREKEDTIPLYRAAVTWSQILIVVIAIPLFAGVYKLDVSPLLQSGLAGVFAFMFGVYFFWSISFDDRARRVNWIDVLVNCAFLAFIVVSTHLTVSFFPTEAFLRGLFSASVVLFGVNYLDGHMKNKINSNLMYHYGLIFLILLLILLAFRP
ncbi:hypothetical protein GF360_03925 [candidate division WWE3 bacterium]|nr:hypothetical protein [candidate division WWE3 bacterium]